MVRHVLKNNGGVVEFDRKILIRSLLNAGASRSQAENITKKIESELADGDSTAIIYKKAFDILNLQPGDIAMRYSLKKALFGLGPTGFQFEKFVAELWRRKGYKTKIGIHMQGTCIDHEIDVHAIKGEKIAFEAKFHNDIHIRTDVKTVLYVKSRFDDLMGLTNCTSRIPFMRKKGVVDRCILITNTKFTSTAIKYAKCSGIELIGWGYPFNDNLQTIIKEVDAHPVTCLPSISNSTLKRLYENDIVTCRGLLENVAIIDSLHNREVILEEARTLCRSDSRN